MRLVLKDLFMRKILARIAWDGQVEWDFGLNFPYENLAATL
jgi:hypothetical protein